MYEPAPKWAVVAVSIIATASLAFMAYMWFVEIPKELEIIKQNEASMEVR